MNKDLEKQIEEAAERFGILQGFKKDSRDFNICSNSYIVGTRSQAAKQYWQQEMYSEEEVEILCLKAINDSLASVNRFMKNSDCKLIDQNIWFEQNKKK